MNIKQLAFLGAIAVFALSAVDTAQADEGSFFAAIGAGASFSPDYEGSDDYEAGGIPFLSLGWKSDPVVPTDGTGLQLGLHDITLNVPGSLEVGIAKLYRPEGLYSVSWGVSYNGGRKESANAALIGMGRIKAHGVGSMGINFEAADSGWYYGLNYLEDLSSKGYGSVITGQVGFATPLTEELTLTPALHTSWADDKHMQTYFGVSQKQGTSSGYQKFDAGSGVKSVGLGVDLDWAFRENWLLNSGLNYTHLTNDAADSPLVKTQGSPEQFEASMALIYMF